MNGTTHSSVHADRVSQILLYPWANFTERVVSTVVGLDLTRHISLTESSDGERYLVANKLGLTGKVVQNLCEPVNKVLDLLGAHVVFGDAHAVLMSDMVFPDTIVLRADGSGILGVGEVKTWWTVRVEVMSVSGSMEAKVLLERPIGQLVSYMRRNSLRYGFLCSYEATIFVRRGDNFRFELSEPVLRAAQGPSVRECLLAFILMMQEDGEFREDPGLNLTSTAVQASTRMSLFRNVGLSGTVESEPDSTPTTSSRIHKRHQSEPNIHAVRSLPTVLCGAKKPSKRHSGNSAKSSIAASPSLASDPEHITPSTLFFGDNEVAKSRATIGQRLWGNPSSKAVFSGSWGGEQVIVKYYCQELGESYSTESMFYQLLSDIDVPEVRHFPKFRACGEVVLCGRFSTGYVLIITLVAGIQMFRIWNSLDEEEQLKVKAQMRSAVQVLRMFGVWQADASLANMIWDQEHQHLTVVDFEHLDPAVGEGSEMLMVFGHK